MTKSEFEDKLEIYINKKYDILVECRNHYASLKSDCLEIQRYPEGVFMKSEQAYSILKQYCNHNSNKKHWFFKRSIKKEEVSVLSFDAFYDGRGENYRNCIQIINILTVNDPPMPKAMGWVSTHHAQSNDSH